MSGADDLRRRRETATALVHRARARDPFGDGVHAALGCAYGFAIALETVPKEIAFIALLICAAVRSWCTWPTYGIFLRDRLGLVLLAWTAWTALSLAWSPDVEQGLVELRAFRMLLVGLALWPVMDRVAWFIGAFLLGAVAQNLVQLGQQLDLLERLAGDGPRRRGLLHPIQTGTILTIAIAWHISAIVNTRRWRRWIFVAGLAAAGLGLVLSGSRGPWLAAAVVIPAGVAAIAIRRRAARRAILVIAGTVVLASAATWPVTGPLVGRRIEQARADLRAVGTGSMDSDVGVRLASWAVGWSMFEESPITGRGTGGFNDGASRTEHGDILPTSHHAHSTYVHVLGCTGIVGAGLLLAAAGMLLWRSATVPRDHRFADGMLMASAAWLAGAAFDAYHLAGQLLGVFAFLFVATIPHRPISSGSPVE